VAAVLGASLLTPLGRGGPGADSQVFYAAARLANDGGNPYDFSVLRAEEASIHREDPRAASAPFTPVSYAYPPLVTAFWIPFLPLGTQGFYWAEVLLLLAAGVVGARLVMEAVGFRDNRLALLAFVVSAPFLLGVVTGNPSNLAFLPWAVAFSAFAKGRPTLGGAVLVLMLAKAPVGVALAAALLLASPALLPPALLGLFAGGALFLGLSLLALGPGAMAAWIDTVAGFGAAVPAAAGGNACCFVGLPSVAAGLVPTALATLVATLVVLVVVAFGLRHRETRLALVESSELRVALLTGAALAASPYLQLSDLVLEALPLLVICSRRLTMPARITLVIWGLGALPPLLIAAFADLALGAHLPAISVFGVALNGLTLGALLLALRYDGQDVRARPAEVRWGPVPRA
jgi:hypothetical protein